MDMEDLDAEAIPMLTEDNYTHWATAALAWARWKKGSDHLVPPPGTSDPPVFPPGAAGDSARRSWQELDDHIAGRLVLSMDARQRLKIPSMEATAATIWRMLKDAHRANPLRYVPAFRRLHSLRYVDGTSMQAYIDEHAELRMRIEGTGFHLPDAHYCMVLLDSLPDSWDVSRLTWQHVLNKESRLPPLPTSQYPDCRRCAEARDRGLDDDFGSIDGRNWQAITASLLLVEQHLR